MMTVEFLDSDRIVLHTVESYLRSLGTPMTNLSPEQHLALVQSARDYLYSNIVQRVPAIAEKILGADLDMNDKARALYLALSEHCMDPVFVNILMQYLNTIQDPKSKLVTGALLVKIASKYIADHTTVATTTSKDKKDKKATAEETTTPTTKELEKINHLQDAITQLLGTVANMITNRTPNVTYPEALALAAAIATNDENTIKEIIASNLPITADIFNILADPTNLIKAALLLEKKDYPKLENNQMEFINSLQRWVFNHLNSIQCPMAYNFLLSVYGPKPDTNKYIVNVKDCGTDYTNLLQVVKFLAN